MANQVNARAEEIKQATQQQQIASEQVLGAIRSASEVAEQTANSTNLIVDSSNQLDNLTYQLGGVLSQVQVVKTTS
jgi:methyl-accepting chemotaxis protein